MTIDVANREESRRHLPPVHEPHPISVIITAMNEIGNLEPTVRNVLAAVVPRFRDFEIIIVDDGSTDGTSALADRLAAENSGIVVHHNDRNRGLAYSYRMGISLARKRYVAWVAGNNIIPRSGLEDLYDRIGQADVLLSYVQKDVRGPIRRSISRLFTLMLNVLFGLRLRYYTGPCVYRTDALKAIETITDGSMIVPEIVIRMLKSPSTYLEIPLQPQPRSGGKSKTFRFQNVVRVLVSVGNLFWDIQVLGPHRHSHASIEVQERDTTIQSGS